MKKLLIALLPFFCLALCAQKTVSLDDISTQWQARTLKLAGSDKANIISMVQSFHKAWPTYSGGELLKFAKSKKAYDNTDKVVDLANGYAFYSEDDPDSENDEQMQACLWKRSNGHSLVAISLHRFSNEIDVLCFYDYDPQTRVLTPEKSLGGLFTPSYPGYRYRVFLPQRGKEMEVREFFGALTIIHPYSWDGMKPVAQKPMIENLDFYQATFSERYFFADEHELCSYALWDVDSDGFPELWLSSEDESYQAVFAVRLTKDLLGGQSDRRTLSFYRGAVCDAGNCGAGCMSSTYCLLSESCKKTWLTEMSEYDMEKDEYSDSEYKIDGEKVSSGEAERIIKSLGSEIVPTAKWHELAVPEE